MRNFSINLDKINLTQLYPVHVASRDAGLTITVALSAKKTYTDVSVNESGLASSRRSSYRDQVGIGHVGARLEDARPRKHLIVV
jgi:hypothetical protein